MATIRSRVEDPNDPLQFEDLTPEQIKQAQRERESGADKREAHQRAKEQDAKIRQKQADINSKRPLKRAQPNSGETPPKPKRYRMAGTGRFSAPPNLHIPPGGLDAVRMETNYASRADTEKVASTLRDQDVRRNNTAGRGLREGQVIGRDVSKPLQGTDDVSKGARKVIRNRNLGRLGAAGAIVGGVGYLTSDGEGITPLQAGVGLGVAGAIAGKDQIAAGAKKVKNTITNRREDKASYRREATAVEMGDMEGAEVERRNRELRQQQRKVTQAGDVPGTATPGSEPQFVDPEERVMTRTNKQEMRTAIDMQNSAIEQQRRAAKELNQLKGAANPNPEHIAAAQARVDAAKADVKAAGDLQTEINARARRTESVTRAVQEETANLRKDPGAAIDRSGEAIKQKAKETVDAVDKKAKPIWKKVAEKGNTVRKKITSKIPGLGGGGQPSAAQSVDAMVDDLPADMPASAKSKAAAGLKTLTKLTTGVGTINLAEDFIYNWRELGFVGALDTAFAGVEGIIAAGGETVDEVMAGEKDVGDVMGDILGGIVTGALSLIPASIKKGANWTADAADALGIDVTDFRYARESLYGWNLNQEIPGAAEMPYRTPAGPEAPRPLSAVTPTPQGYDATPEGQRVGEFVGVQPIEEGKEPASQEFVGPRDLATTTQSGLRVAPAKGGLGGIPGAVTQQQFLRPGRFPGEFQVQGLRGSGAGVIDATNAVGGPAGFDRRVEESRLAGAYEQVSQARRDTAEEDLERVRAGIRGIRDLAATNKGVPEQYLDDVRNGSLTRSQASKLGALGLRNAKPSDPYAANKELRAQSQELRDQYKFRQEVNAADREVITGIGDDFAAANSDDEREQAELSRNFKLWAANRLSNANWADLNDQQLGTVMGEYEVLTTIARAGQGFFAKWNPFSPRVTVATLTQPGESILNSMLRDGTLFDIRDNNLLFKGQNEAGEWREFEIPLGDFPEAAQLVITDFMSQNPDRFQRGLR